MKKILFGITGLTLGGAERVLVDLANKISDKYDVTIFTIYGKGELEKQLLPNVKLHTLNNFAFNDMSKMQKIMMSLKVLLCKKSIYKKEINKGYDIEIAFLEGPITRLFNVKNQNAKKIAWIHNDISRVFGKGIKSKLKKYVDKKTYKNYNKLVFVSKDNLNRFEETYPDIKTNKCVIYNYLDKDRIKEKSCEKVKEEFRKDVKNFVTVARLVEQKGIDRLIQVHSRLIKNGYNHNFYVIGDGPERDKLEKLIIEQDVKDTFFLLGKRENPYPYIKMADYFCLLSYYEGYGMVLEEAKILDRFIIITNTAAREAVEDYPRSMILENSEEEIYEGIKNLLTKSNKTNESYNQKDDIERIKKENNDNIKENNQEEEGNFDGDLKESKKENQKDVENCKQEEETEIMEKRKHEHKNTLENYNNEYIIKEIIELLEE